MDFLPKWVLTRSLPAFKDGESATALEQSYRLYKAMQELIDDYNTFAENVNVKMTEFVEKYNGDMEVFITSFRQEFQDFIDVVELQIMTQQETIANGVKEDIEEYLHSDLKVEMNQMVAESVNEQLGDIYTKEEVDSTFAKAGESYSKTESDNKYAEHSAVVLVAGKVDDLEEQVGAIDSVLDSINGEVI